MVRVIAGKAKNKKLLVPESITRPVTDRIKTTVFDLLRDFLQEANVLDLFAGSGAYGIEALSRGASRATFIDASNESIDIIEENLRNCAFQEESTVVKGQLPLALNQLTSDFDIIFCDPPFTKLDEFDIKDYEKLITSQNIFVLRLPVDYKFKTEGSIDIAYEKIIGISTILFLRRIVI